MTYSAIWKYSLYYQVEQVNAKIEEEVKTEDVEQGTEIKESVVTEVSTTHVKTALFKHFL